MCQQGLAEAPPF
ncbi:hypothetical protein BIW11_04180 [Tropilaelaps mercedesae]|uniref:Uncharacterized protein n=1 Tax=Tropilaelaps mercedesae TaxID=418985 RepID=A0A1V9XAC9_9ACAR|nr:hypothetical protein BIW11_04180 [Tropilaelaps mercedesae]